MNRKILMAGGVMAFVAAIALGATYAAWQASDTIDGNTVSTVSLTIDAEGVGGYGLNAAPLVWENALPGEKSAPANRAEISNDSSIALDLYMYVVPTASSTCTATKIAWRSAVAGTGSFDYGYLGPEPVNVGTKAGVDTDDNFTLISDLANPVKIADDSKFTPGVSIALQEIAGLATDAEYPADAGTCEWTEVFIGTLPGEAPVVLP